MRFGKRPRAARFFGRKSEEPATQTATPESAAYEPVQHDEWNELVTPDDDPEWDAGLEAHSVDDMGEGDSMSGENGREATLDPTNRLLTALGRFHREVLKAREGSVHGQWTDVCVNQLISAVEIALAQGWSEVVEALGETGRILQSYADAGRADDSVEFLEDAYELLCLMVGDLIVGSVRAGVVEKWKERYARAVEDLEAAGLELVDDDEPTPRATDAPPLDAGAAADSAFDELPALDTLAPLEDEVPVPEPAHEAVMPDSSGQLDAVTEALARIESDPAGQHPAAFAAIADAVETLQQEARGQGRSAAAFASDVMLRLCEGAQQVDGALDDRFFELSYGFPGLYAEASDDFGDDSVDNWTMECETLLVSWSALGEQADAAEPVPDTEPGIESPEALDAAPFDSAALDSLALDDVLTEREPSAPHAEVPDLGADIDAMEGRAIDAEPDPGLEAEPAGDEWEQPGPDALAEAPNPVDAVSSEPPALHDEPAEDESEAMRQAVEDIIAAEAGTALEEAVGPSPVDEVIDTPMQILKVAEQAVSEGRASNAKLLLLQAAASIAEAEATEAHKALEEATARIQQESEAIEAAMAAVTEAETRVAEAEQAVAEGAEAVEAGRARVSEQHERVGEVQTRIDEIDEQIRALQARRDEEVATLEQSRGELAAAETHAAEVEAEVTRQQESEAGVRQQLEEARAQVKHHQRKRQEYESALDKANDEVRQRSESLSELQQTMSRFGLAPSGGEPDDSGDLFGQDEAN